MCSVGTCIVDILILDKHRYAFCQLKNSGRLLIVISKENTPSVIGVFGWKCIVDIFSFNTPCQSVNRPSPGDYKLQNPIEHTFH